MPPPLRLTPELVAKIPASIPDPGAMDDISHLQTPHARAQVLDDVLSTRPDAEALWVFAFGSLMWKPDFAYAERHPARALGWQRSFCMGPDTRYRGNPENPGIMLTLDRANDRANDRGGSCEGVVFRMDEARLRDDLAMLIAREPPIPPEWVEAETALGPVRALAFVCTAGQFAHIGDMAPEDIARQIAPAVGMYGSMAEYVFNTARHLEEMGIHDPTVWEMQELVAAELEALP